MHEYDISELYEKKTVSGWWMIKKKVSEREALNKLNGGSLTIGQQGDYPPQFLLG